MSLKKTATIFFLIGSIPFYAFSKCSGTKGEIVACHVNKAYNNATSWCGEKASENRSGGLCSGVLIRGASLAPKRSHNIWDIRPEYKGVSFSYLRKDAGFDRLAYGYKAGFILYPYDHTPHEMTALAPKCGFPFDGDTVNRSDFCGQDRSFTESQPCYQLTPPVNTDKKWLEHFKKYDVDPASGAKSCGFMFTGVNANEQFNTFIKSRNLVIQSSADHKEFHAENEVVVPRWDVSEPKKIPIEAFFYLSNSAEGLQSAQADQLSLYNATAHHLIVPILSLKLPESNLQSGDYNPFSYSENDQKIK